MSTVALALQLFLATMTHPGHISMAEAEYVDGKLEVALQVNWQDLDSALTQSKVTLRQWLTENFLVRDSSGKVAELHLLGSEAEIFHTWIYFEIKLEKPISNYTLQNSLFLELPHGRQVNTVQLRTGKRLRTLHFTRNQPRSQL